ncbi:MAG TPA: inorganic pyrophosphatase [Ignavibacteria bacterium]|nr:inorganic pyrophosphatase [Bacteroidota bacterium]HRI85329.1 inorganic pyrophosphatase [Ignavibacteria bacterium]HRJ98077.1 inorganic pyrophosphatase [Ignavibacteria bacterium]
MSENILDEIWSKIRLLLKSHPWHGVPIGNNIPETVTTYIEIVPTDTVKYEIEKNSGYLKVDRPQKYSNICPTPYGFIPQTLCAENVGEYCMKMTGRDNIIGDNDPLDICVITEKSLNHSNILLQAIPIGGLRMIDNNEADDKIIAVMKDDAIFSQWKDISDCSESFIERLKHYFLTYKDAPGSEGKRCEIQSVYGKDEAYEIINASHSDYLKRYGDLNTLLNRKDI